MGAVQAAAVTEGLSTEGIDLPPAGMPATDAYLRAVGAVSVAFNQLELEAEGLVHWLIGNAGLGRAISQGRRFEQLADLVKRLAGFRWPEESEPLQQFEAWVADAKRIAHLRHEIIHGIALSSWQRGPDEPWEEVVAVIRRGEFEPTQAKTEELVALAGALREAMARGFRLRVDHSTKVRLPDPGDGTEREEFWPPWAVPAEPI